MGQGRSLKSDVPVGFCGLGTAPRAFSHTRWDDSLCPLPLSACSHPRHRRASHRAGPESKAKNLSPLGPRPGLLWYTCVRGPSITDAAFCGWNVPFVPWTIPRCLEPRQEGAQGRAWEPPPHRASWGLAPPCVTRALAAGEQDCSVILPLAEPVTRAPTSHPLEGGGCRTGSGAILVGKSLET